MNIRVKYYEHEAHQHPIHSITQPGVYIDDYGMLYIILKSVGNDGVCVLRIADNGLGLEMLTKKVLASFDNELCVTPADGKLVVTLSNRDL